MMTTLAAPISSCVSHQLTAESILDVVAGKKLAIVCDGFLDTKVVEIARERFLAAGGWGRYVEPGTEGIRTFAGEALFQCQDAAIRAEAAAACERYFATAIAARTAVRELLSPFANPIDRLHIVADEIWPAGCGLMKFGDKPGNAGLVRCVSEGGEFRPHVDRADWDFECYETNRLRAQLAVVQYLAMTEHGGELELWDLQPDREQHAKMRVAGDYSLHRSFLGEPDLVISPKPSTLCVFNAWRVHAVRKSTGKGVRLTVSGFWGYETPYTKLSLFS